MYKDVLLAIDLDDPSSWAKALPVAVGLCQAFGARLHAFTAVPDMGMSVVAQYFPENYEAKALEAAGKQLAMLLDDKVPDDVELRHTVGLGTVYQEILEAAREIDADLIVLSSHRPELKDYLLGPNAARVVRHSNRSVLVVRE
jgi:nucleotide-binding universal stress UspA family protein